MRIARELCRIVGHRCRPLKSSFVCDGGTRDIMTRCMHFITVNYHDMIMCKCFGMGLPDVHCECSLRCHLRQSSSSPSRLHPLFMFMAMHMLLDIPYWVEPTILPWTAIVRPPSPYPQRRCAYDLFCVANHRDDDLSFSNLMTSSPRG